MKDLQKIKEFFSKPLKEERDIYDEISNEEFGMDYDQLGPNEKEWVRDEISNLNEGISPEVINKVNRFIKALAKYYDYSEQDAVYAIMQALRTTNFQGINEAKEIELNDKQKKYLKSILNNRYGKGTELGYIDNGVEEFIQRVNLDLSKEELQDLLDKDILKIKTKPGKKPYKALFLSKDLNKMNLNEAMTTAYESKSISDYKVGDILKFKDGEDWKVMKVKDNVGKLVIKPHNEKAKEGNVSLEIDIDASYLKNNLNEAEAQEQSLYKDWDQFEKPSKIKVYLNNGKTLEINPLRLKGGKRVYDAILQAFIDDRFDITNKVIQGMTNNLSEAKEEDAVDTITMDIPLFLRMLEYAREDAEQDLDLHDVTEKANKLGKERGILQMDDYEEIVGVAEDKMNEGMGGQIDEPYFIQVSARDAQTAIDIFNKEYRDSNIKKYGSGVYAANDVSDIYDFFYDLNSQDIEILDANVDGEDYDYDSGYEDTLAETILRKLKSNFKK